MNTRTLTQDFDPSATDDPKDVHALYRELRERCPVAYSDAYGGFWTGLEVALAASKSSANQAGGKLMASYPLSEEGNRLLNEQTSAVSPFDADGIKDFTRVKDLKSVDAKETRRLLGLN